MTNKAEVKKESPQPKIEPIKVENYFITLNDIDVSKKTEKKNGLTYLSWAWAWGEIKKIHPKANYKIYEREDGCFYWTDGKTCWVKTGVIVNDIEHIEYLPVMDFKNKSILLENITSFDVNKAIQRSLTKAVARHGLGLYVYAGEDLPNQETQGEPKEEEPNGKILPKQLEWLTQVFGSEDGAKKLPGWLTAYNIKQLSELTEDQANDMIGLIRKNAKK